MSSTKTFHWTTPFLGVDHEHIVTYNTGRYALIILNQPFLFPLLRKLWKTSVWHCCADGGANRLHDTLKTQESDLIERYLPELIKGDLDSIRDDVREYYSIRGVTVVHDHDQDSSDLMKCIVALQEKEKAEGVQYDIIILGGLSGRLDQTIHLLSQLHKLRKTRERVFAVTEESLAWVLDEGEHYLHLDQTYLGITCGLLPIGVDHTMLTTRGLEWNLTDCKSHFDGMVSTSNHLVPGEDTVYIKTSKPLLWTVELRDQPFMRSSATPMITVLYFAAASTATGLTEETVPLPDNGAPLPLSALPALLAERHPGVGLENILKSSQWSVDAVMVDEDEENVILKGGEEVAVICPVSGG